MADIAFVLLFFFLSTTKFDQKYGLGIVLPGPTTDETERVRLRDENLTRILVSRDGVVAVNNEVLTLHELEARARFLLRENPQMVFNLRTDRQSRYVYMIEVLDRLRLAGAQRINLSTN